MKKILLFIASIGCVVLLAACSALQGLPFSSTITVGDPGAPSQLPAAILDACTNGARDITITPGTYVLPASGKTSFEWTDWANTVIHAKGVTIIFEELAHRPVRLLRCEHVMLEGATLRFARPAFTQGRIVAMGKDGREVWLDWKIDAGYATEFDPVKSTMDVVDQRTRLLKMGTGDFGCHAFETNGPGLFRLHKIHGGVGMAEVGDWIFTRHPPGDSIVQLDNCDRCTMRDVTLQNAGFAAFFETGGAGGNLFQDCRIMPGPKPDGATEEQLVGCGADGFHSVGTRTGPTIERCSWLGVLHDDCIAIHGSLQQVVRTEGSRLFLERGNRGGFAVGDPVRISCTNGYFAEFTCVAMKKIKEQTELLELTLDRESNAPGNSKASNPLHNGAGFRILNCKLGNCRSRGILVKGDNGLIEGCTISGCGMSAISIGPEYYWNEADYSHNVTIRRNKLAGNVLNGSSAGTVFVHGDGAIGNRNITIAGNLFDRNYGQNSILAGYTDGLHINRNRFITCPLRLPDKARTVLALEFARNIELESNVVENSAPDDALVKPGRNVDAFIGDDKFGTDSK